MKSKSRIWEICFNASWPLDGCWEEHDRESQACEWNRTGDEWSYCLHFSFPFSQSMNCFIMIKDKTGINDTFTFSHQKLVSISMKAAVDLAFSPFFSAGTKTLTGQYTRWRYVFLDLPCRLSLLGTCMVFVFKTVKASLCQNVALGINCFFWSAFISRGKTEMPFGILQ